MDLQGFSVQINEAVNESITLAQHKNGRTYKYELVALFARIWFLKAQILGRTVTREFVKSLREGSRFLLTSFTPKFKEMSILVEQVPLQVESQNGKNSTVGDLLHKFLVQAMLFKAEVFLSELGLKLAIGTLREGIVFLIKLDTNQPKTEVTPTSVPQQLTLLSCYDTEDEKLVFADIKRLAAGVISVCRSKAGIKSMESQLSDLLEEVGSMKSKLKKLYFRRPDSDFPKTPGVGPVELLLERLKDIQFLHHVSVAFRPFPVYQIEVIRWDMELCLEYSDGADDKTRAQLVEASYQVYHVIDSMRGTNYSESLLLMWLYDQSLLIKDLLVLLTALRSESQGRTWRYRTSEHSLDMEIEPPISQGSPPWSHSRMVGFEEEKTVIIDRLTSGTKRREVVSITGMACAGKTTLARDVFMTSAIVHHFQTRAWCTVSQVYTKRKLLRKILSQITEDSDGVLARSATSDLENMLRKSLKGKRYLIVMDDVWSREVFSDLQISLPDDSRQNRILMTSRNVKVVPNPYPLRGLTEEESCELLRLRTFGDEGWPLEHLVFAKQVAQLCQGLPLAIVAVADILGTMQKNSWPKVGEHIYSLIATHPMIMATMALSYLDLPNDLKECFLYFGVYPKDEDILVQNLLWSWIAEGFIRKVGLRSLEDLAEDYLMILIDRHLVSGTKLGSNGKVKKCRVQSVLLELCLLKAKDANFHVVLNQDSDASDFRISTKHRVTVIGNPDKFIATKPSGTNVRSLLHFGTDKMYPGCHSDMGFISEKFEILKVMSLESINVGYTLENDNGLPVYLIYLALSGDMTSLPSSLLELQYLQTLVVKGLMNKFVLPSAIWSMESLRHIDVSNHCIFTLQNDGYGTLDSLVSLSMPSFSYVKETDYILKRFPKLRKLKCILLEPCVGSKQISQFPALGSLLYLESLKLTYHGWPLNTVEWNFPSTLKELSLSKFCLPWEKMSAIGELPNLEVLKLISKAIEGTTWEMVYGEFKKLRSLELVSLNIVHWNADEDHLPSLEKLVLRNCKELEVPPGFGHICTLQRIDAHQCGLSVEESIRNVVETQLEYGNACMTSNVSRL